MSVVATRIVVDGAGPATSTFTGAGLGDSGQPRKEPIKGSQQCMDPSQDTVYLNDSKKVKASIDFL